MKNRVEIQRLFGAVAIGLCALPAGLASAGTIFTNEGFTSSGQALPASYGDRVSASSANFTVTDGGTPNVAVSSQVIQGHPSYAPGTGSFQTHTDFPSSQGGAIALSGGPVEWFQIVFTPDPGYAVSIDSWDFLEAPGGGSTTFGWIIYETGNFANTYASGDPEEFTNSEDELDLGGRLSVEGAVGGITGDVGQSLTLTFSHSGSNPGSVAVDNIQISQVAAVPEPATVGLAMLGLTALGLRRRAGTSR